MVQRPASLRNNVPFARRAARSAARRWLLATTLWCLLGAPSWAQAPNDLAWTQTNGPVGGAIIALAVDATTGYLFAGTYDGVFRSTDQGASWQKAGLDGAQIRDLFVYGNTLYVRVVRDGLYRSTDDGATWQAMGVEFPSNLMRLMVDTYGRLWVSFSERDAETNVKHKKLYRSTDGGRMWEQMAFPSDAWMESVLVYPGTGHLLAGTLRGVVYRSNDDGATWQRSDDGLPGPNLGPRLTLDRHTGDVYVGFYTERLYRSKDRGETWEDVGFPHDCVVALVIDVAGYIYVGTPEHALFRSIDGGNTWQEANTGLPAIPYDEPYFLTVTALVLTAEGHLLAGTNRGGVYQSTDQAEAWTPVNTGLIVSYITALTVTEQGRVLGSMLGGQLFSSMDEGRTWTLSRVPVSSINTFAVDADGHLLAAGGASLLRSRDGGQTWTTVKTTGLEPSQGFLSLVLSAEGDLYLGTEYGVYRSADNGETWTATALLVNVTGYLNIRALLQTPSGDLFAGSNKGLYRSTDRGATWRLTGLDDRIQSMIVTAEGHLLAGGDRIHRSTDQGASWQIVYQGMDKGKVHVKMLLVDAEGNILVGTSYDGILRSVDGGETWQPANVGLPAGHVPALAVHPGTGQLFAGTSNGGVFRSDPPTPVGVDQFADAVPADVSLLQNYPNPFRAATTIAFALSEATRVRLVVYDGLGREVAVLVDAPMQPGIYRLPFATDSLPSGLYVYRLETQAQTVTQTMVHVR